MENKMNDLADLLEWIDEWREKHGISNGTLQGSILDMD